MSRSPSPAATRLPPLHVLQPQFGSLPSGQTGAYGRADVLSYHQGISSPFGQPGALGNDLSSTGGLRSPYPYTMSTALPSSQALVHDDQQPPTTVAYPVANQPHRSYRGHGHRFSPYVNDATVTSQQHRYRAAPTQPMAAVVYSAAPPPPGQRAPYVSGAELSPRPQESAGKDFTTQAAVVQHSPNQIVVSASEPYLPEQQGGIRHNQQQPSQHHPLHAQVAQQGGYSSVFLTPPPSAQELAANVGSPDQPHEHSSVRFVARDRVHPPRPAQAKSSEPGAVMAAEADQKAGGHCHYNSSCSQPTRGKSEDEESADEASSSSFNNLWQPPTDSAATSRGQGQPVASPKGSSSDDSQESSSMAGEPVFSLPNGKMSRLSDEFAKVPGRLSLLGSASKYSVTVGEVRRRLAPPECLNASLLGGVLRKAKSKNGGSDLRKTLDEIGLNLPPGRRKAASTSMLTSLVEEEARALANQFTGVCSKMFPVAELANCVAEKHTSNQAGGSIEERLHDIRSASQITKELCSLLEAYIAGEEADPDNDHVQLTGLRQFSLITHGFGVLVVHGVLTLYQQYLASLEKRTNGHIVSDNHVLHSSAAPTSDHMRRAP